jgi:hypothetical protein
LVLDRPGNLDGLDGGGAQYRLRVFGGRGLTGISSVVRDAKDIAASAVLVTALAAAVIGALIFWPYLAKLIS